MQKRRRRERRFHPGMLVRIVDDCRGGHRDRRTGRETGSEAIFEGYFDRHTGRRYTGPRAGEQGNPKMTLPDGQTIWGMECYWLPLKEAQDLEKKNNTPCTTGQRFPVEDFSDILRLVDKRTPWPLSERVDGR